MKKTWLVLKHEFRQTVRKKTYILLVVSLPLLILLGYGIYEGVQHWKKSDTEETKRIGFVDHAGIFDEYTSPSGLLYVPYSGEEEAKSALLSDEVEDYIVLPENYVTTGQVTIFTKSKEVEISQDLWLNTEAFLLANLLHRENVSNEIIERAQVPMVPTSVRLDDTGEEASEFNEFTDYGMPLIFGMVFLFSLMFTSGFLLQSVGEEKENRVMEVLLSSVSAGQLFVGKVLALGAAGLLQVAIWLASIKIFSEVGAVKISIMEDLTIPYDVLALAVLYFVLGYLLFAALMAGVGAMCSTSRESQSLSSIFSLPAAMPLWISYVIISEPESALTRGLTLFPLTAPITAMMRVPSHSIPAWELALSLAILAGSVVLTMWASSKVFHAYLLMYGKRPGIREIAKAIRQA